MRIFVALNLPGSLVEALAESAQALRERYPDARWTPEDHLHITLAFLGDIEEPGVTLLREAADRAVQGRTPFALHTGKLFTLPRGKPAKVLAVSIEEGRTAIAALAEAVENRLAEADYPFRPAEKRAFVPHITLARRRNLPLKLLPEDRDRSLRAEGIAEGLTVFKSDLYRGGPVYTPLSSRRFASEGVYGS
ncbi:MAG: RNA 2',3'-cyclic phosphodiesterase [Spirochaetaceae bacterium]|jgi:2'-5' RNA ligase|nr:RNA 2',3'-cyclic phosphodiesterase [Spirochaetaceae bacterium]